MSRRRTHSPRCLESTSDKETVCSLERRSEAPDLTEADRSALHFADLFATDHLAIDDAVYEDLRRHFTEDELVELGLHCAIAVGFGRLAATWNVTDDVPEAFRAAGGAAPWAGSGVVASG